MPKAQPAAAPTVNTAMRGFAGIPGGAQARVAVAEEAPEPAHEAPPGMQPETPPETGAECETDQELAAQVAEINAEAMSPPEEVKRGGLFSRLSRKREAEPEPAPIAEADEPQADASFEEEVFGDASFEGAYEDAAYDEAALADPALVAEALGEKPPQPHREDRRSSIVAIGWGAILLILALVVGLLALAPSTVVSMLPGAARLYDVVGMPVGSQGLAFQGVRYGWINEGGQTLLEVQGNVVNVSSSALTVPAVVIALRDEDGEEISEWTTEVGEAELAAGETAPFLRQIPSPPSNVRSLKVRFGKAE